MLPRNERLGTTAFAQAFAQSRTFHHALLQMRVHWRQGQTSAAEATTSDAQKTCVAFVVAKKLGRATVRNRMRRRLREAYRLSHQRNSPLLQNLDIIFMVKAGALEAQSAELYAAIDELLMRLSQGNSSRSHSSRGEKKDGYNRGTQGES
jgi:ribonuclease P protein component